MLEQVEIFAHIPAAELQQLEQKSRLRRIPRNTVLFMEGDDGGQLIVIREGRVCVHTQDSEGHQFILNYMGEGECFGELSLLDAQPRSASVSTVTECELLCISREQFLQFMNDNPQICQQLIISLTAMVRRLTGNVKDIALLDVYGRVVRVLERYSDDQRRIARPKLKHHEIASMVGASREMVSRIMKELVVGGYIEIHPKCIQIVKAFPKGW